MPNSPKIVSAVLALRDQVRAWRAGGETVGLVPTMGALHEGHLDLVRLAKARFTRVVVSIFVNPAQFAPHEDFDRYPRAIEADAQKLAPVSVDLIYAPTAAEMYPAGFATRIVPAGAAQGLESDFRPHFFAGVAVVCCKLFTQVAPDAAIFGEKDYQQLCVIRQLVRDLNLPLAIIGAPTKRDADGLALSSRNAYLSAEERRIAPALHSALVSCGVAIKAGMAPEAACAMARDAILAAGFQKVDYVDARDAVTLAALSADGKFAPIRLLAAAWLGKTRLIDNVGV